jgi:cytochrome c
MLEREGNRQARERQDQSSGEQERRGLVGYDCDRFVAMKSLKALLVIYVLILAACASHRSNSDQERYFMAYVKPVLEANCLRCHNGPAAAAGLDLSNGERLLKLRSPRTGRPFVIPGDPDCSLLVAAISRKGTHPKVMPRLEVSLTDDQIGALSEWIEYGAYWPEARAGHLHTEFNQENP